MSLLAGKAVVRDGGNAVLGARTEANLAKSAAGIDPGGTRTAFRATDITDEGQCEAPAAPARERFGGIDAVVQVAAWGMWRVRRCSSPRTGRGRSRVGRCWSTRAS
ncbi:short chain dehydrogenase [Streptomyces hygroscopicus subsp. jinggangensis 5008]|nr:short chain dehydrogenase [Streptomyces hygroscopicus subsp. jinggangensis 5008]AGF64130.1 short chain dehydrogenase [Streptomyces hygroscopicus subsp. jinggangensis TL01]